MKHHILICLTAAMALAASCCQEGQRFYPASKQQVNIGEDIAVASTQYGKIRGYIDRKSVV